MDRPSSSQSDAKTVAPKDTMQTISWNSENTSSGASLPTPDTRDKTPGQHTRNYQACIPCRRRKVKCDLGPVDDPRDPPCLRCRRESKECFFSATRRKRKNGESGEDDSDDDAPEAKSSRKRSRTTGSMLGGWSRLSSVAPPRPEMPPITPGGGLGRSRPLARPSHHSRTQSAEEAYEKTVNNNTTAQLQRSEIYTAKDSLNTLNQLNSGASADILKRRHTISSPIKPNFQFSDIGGGAPAETPRKATFMRSGQSSQLQASHDDTKNLEALASLSGLDEAMHQWSRTKFVQAGWFTASEAVRFIDFFYRQLLPLTPITMPDFQDPSSHGKLLHEEPMLTVTILTIASRHLAPQYPENLARNILTHQKLWDFLSSMINRITLGDEPFQLGFQGHPLSARHHRNYHLRGLGAIESLLLLTEWQPQAVHFPSCDSTDNMIVEYSGSDRHIRKASAVTSPTTDIYETCAREAEKRKAESWVCPFERGNRMSWSFIGMAVNIAYELGLLNGGSMPESINEERAENVRRLLYVFSVQTSGRLSLPSYIAHEHWKRVFDNLKDNTHFKVKPPPPDEASQNDEHASQTHIQETIHHFWYRIAKMFAAATKKLFPSAEHSKLIISNGEYSEDLFKLGMKHKDWLHDFNTCSIIPAQMRHVLEIEFYYMRIYCHNIALQAVVNRCVNNEPRSDGSVIPPDILARWMGDDRKYIDMIIEDSQAVLDCVVNKLYRDGFLKDVPTRTLLRLPSVSTILVKTFTFGVNEGSLSKCFSLLDSTVQALQNSSVDDLHFSSSFAVQIESLTSRVRANLVRVNKKNKDGKKQNSPGTGRPSSISAPEEQKPFLAPDGSSPSSLQERMTSFADHRNPGYRPSPLQNVTNAGQASPVDQWNFGLSSYTTPGYGPINSQQAMAQAPAFNPVTQSYDPLRGITTWDPQSVSRSIMPPPGFTPIHATHVAQQQANGTQGDMASIYVPTTGSQSESPTGMNQMWNNYPVNWFALDMQPLYQYGPAEVRQSDFGPIVGNQDMLEIMTPADPSGAPPSEWGNLDNQGR